MRKQQEDKIVVMRVTIEEELCDAVWARKLQEEYAYDALSVNKNTREEHRHAKIVWEQQEGDIFLTRVTTEEKIRDAKIYVIILVHRAACADWTRKLKYEDAHDALNIKKHTGEELRDANTVTEQQEEKIVVTR